MGIIDKVKSMIFGKADTEQYSIEELLGQGSVEEVLGRLQQRHLKCEEAFREYDPKGHYINQRPDKIVTDKKGGRVRKERTWKLPIPYQQYINEVSVVFLYGKPLRWVQTSVGTDAGYKKFLQVLTRCRFDAKIRQAKRLAGAETESALLFRVYKDDDGQADIQLRVLAKSKGDGLYYSFDRYENLTSFGWVYHIKDAQGLSVRCFDYYTKSKVWRCEQGEDGWVVTEEDNLIGRIPVILFQQDKEWAGVEDLIYREEYIASRTADTNDYFADPIAVMNADVIKNLPEKQDTGKLLVTNSASGVSNAIKFETWDSAPESKRLEIEWLQNQILSKTFTPNITLDTLKSLQSMSGKALRTVMMLADIKASRHKEQHDEYLSRLANLVKATIGNVLDISLKAEMDTLEVHHEWSEPFGEDTTELLNNITSAVDGKILSRASALSLNPLVRDAISEKQLLDDEATQESAALDGLLSPGGALSY